MLAFLYARAAASDIALPLPAETAEISVRADQANHWRDGSYEVWVLRGNCQIVQDNVNARSSDAVLWVDRAEPLSGRTSKIIAYVEGDVAVDYGHDGRSRPGSGPAAHSIRDRQWLGRFYTLAEIDIQAPVTGFEPRVKPAVFRRGMEARQEEVRSPVRQAQFLAPATGPPPSARRISIRSRSNVRMQYKMFPSPDGTETIAVFTSGIKVIVEGIQNVPGMTDDKVDVEADRIVIWTAPFKKFDLTGEASGEKMQPKDAPLEFYMEGNIVFREGDRVIYAERMYYNVRGRYGIILNAEVLTPAPGYQGLVRLKADVLQQLNEYSFRAFAAAITSSRMGVPRYWLQAESINFQDVQTQLPDPDPTTGDPAVEHQYLTTSRNNFLYLAGVPVMYWPVMATDLKKPTYFVDSFRLGNDSVFGFQVRPDLDVYHLLGIRNAPEGTDWTVSPHYLSQRGFGLGTNFEYDRFGVHRIPGPVRGVFDAWGLKDSGLDNLGRDRRAVPLDEAYRGRALWQHRHYLPNGFQLTGELGLISDRNFLEQYYEREWDEFKDQMTGLELKQLSASNSWSISSNARLNDFFTQTEWLPRLDHFLLGHSLFDHVTWFAHSHIGYAQLGTVDPGIFAFEPAQVSLPWETDTGGVRFDDRSGVRTATRHEFDLPLPLGPFKVTPYALGEVAYWGQDRDGTDVRRLYGQAGVRGSIPFWKVNPHVHNVLFNLNGLAHKVVLDAEFSWADADRRLDRFPLYDPLDDDATEHFRRRFIADPLVFGGVLPVEFDERYYALRTGMQSWVTAPSTEIADDLTVIQAGVRQRWQTKRGFPGQERIIDWIVFDLEGSFFPNPDRDNFGEEVGLLKYDFRWHVGDRFTVLSDGFADVFHDGLRTFSLGGMLSRPFRGNVYAGFRSIEGPISSNIFSAAVNYRMSEKWIMNAGGAIDLGATGNIGERITFTRIGESILLRVGFNVDHSRGNVGVAFAIEPRFLSGSLGQVGGVPISPVGAFGVE
ncbi:MAG: LPS-assembly protein LptD [Pirellulaceae bacterium]|nr:LPS-assembly protein LptD [Pirellulaceae bacterium]